VVGAAVVLFLVEASPWPRRSLHFTSTLRLVLLILIYYNILIYLSLINFIGEA
jgi:hypothetical protein